MTSNILEIGKNYGLSWFIFFHAEMNNKIINQMKLLKVNY